LLNGYSMGCCGVCRAGRLGGSCDRLCVRSGGCRRRLCSCPCRTEQESSRHSHARARGHGSSVTTPPRTSELRRTSPRPAEPGPASRPRIRVARIAAGRSVEIALAWAADSGRSHWQSWVHRLGPGRDTVVVAENGSEIVGGGNSRSGVACGSASMHHCCSCFKDAARDLLRLLLMTSAARVQSRSDVDGSWSRPTSFPQEACAWEIRNCCTQRNFRRHCIRKRVARCGPWQAVAITSHLKGVSVRRLCTFRPRWQWIRL
jgi:hypothetical protein